MNDFVQKYAARRAKLPPITASDVNSPTNWACAILERSPWVLHQDDSGKITGVEIDVGQHATRDTTVAPIIRGLLDLGFKGIEDKTAIQGPWQELLRQHIIPVFNFDSKDFVYGSPAVAGYEFTGGAVRPPTRIALQGSNVSLALNLLNRDMELESVAALDAISKTR